MTNLRVAASLLLAVLLFIPATSAWSQDPLPIEPDLNSRLDELYDHEARLFIMLYSLHGDGKVDYITGRLVQEYTRSNYGNPVYYTEPYPLFYWWDHTMFNDPDQDGVNGNERVYQENIEFDIARYKPCLFNGQPC
ncbi:MAG: hypothetical protein WAU44_07805 [Nitrospira sp.]|jgi:hypothetical protein|uniref:hypothetical protein n=1 Tax=Nitrospira sp. ND1 TaxID=1658518 RepID=UPI0009BAFF2F|nr:hypothetical protein [Nitrospira sp. ND1]MBK7420128.1 hypothetical protein [Nitrospira sp.]OYT22380.1 MAG: hypothetical protein CCU27_14790 [Nitrospira sp. UW-LDO-02]MBK7487739.1 hypothetical protein [Nitrospira sp.]MBK8379671.1 hypothetical protein [Nitrospira sp.]MBK9999099.1 hypothetical protein [Nitrospira sp.]